MASRFAICLMANITQTIARRASIKNQNYANVQEPTIMLETVDHTLHDAMTSWITAFKFHFGLSNIAATSILTALIFSAGLLLFYVFRPILLGFIARLAKRKNFIWTHASYHNHVFHRLLLIIPGVVIYLAIPLITFVTFPFAQLLAKIIEISAKIYLVGILAAVISAMLNCIETRYRHLQISRQYSIKSYLQVIKIILFGLSVILSVSILINQSPTYLLTGLGAMTAVTLLIFRDSILGFVTSIQLSAYDMVRIGDWIEIPKYGANGDVIDLSLTTMKVQNFDKTIVTIPSYALLSDGVKNWRGMSESGGRRIKRAINIDVNSIKFCSTTLFQRLSQLSLLKETVAAFSDSDDRHTDAEIAGLLNADSRSITNLEIFRRYIEAYLTKHPNIKQNMTFLVRELQDTGGGIPIEIYVFSNVTQWSGYERIQADIFDHIYASLALFELKHFQSISNLTFTPGAIV